MVSNSITKEATAAVFRTIAHSRRSCKRFTPNMTIPQAKLKDILASTLRTPSSFNLQPTQIVMVQDQIMKEQLAEAAMLGVGNQHRTRDCATMAVFLADLEASKRIHRILRLEKESRSRHPAYLVNMPVSSAFLLGEGHAATLMKQIATNVMSNVPNKAMPSIEPIQTWAYKNTALAVQSYVLAATSHNLQTSIMEGLDPRKVKEILRIPDRYGIPMVVATGYEYAEEYLDTPRLALDEVVFGNTFGAPMVWDDEVEQRDDKIERNDSHAA